MYDVGIKRMGVSLKEQLCVVTNGYETGYILASNYELFWVTVLNLST